MPWYQQDLLGFAAGVNPRVGSAIMGQQMQDLAQRQAATLQADFQQIAQSQGLDAAKKYLVEAQKQVGPGVGGVVQKKMEELQTRQRGAQAAEMLFSKDPAQRQQGIGMAFQAFEPDVAVGLVKQAMPESKLYTVGSAPVTPAGEVVYKGKSDKLPTVGIDVNQELFAMGYNPTDVLEAHAEGNSEAQAIMQQAISNKERRAIEGEQRRHSQRVGEVMMGQRAFANTMASFKQNSSSSPLRPNSKSV